MKYEGYKIGPVIRDIRKDKGLLIEEVAAKTGISVSTLGDYVWKYVFVCWTGRVPYTYLQSVLGETSVGEWLSFIPGCLIFTGISMVYYFWWVNHWEGNRISE